MAKADIEREIQARVEAFTDDLSEMIREAAIEAVQEALGAGTAAPARTTKRKAKKHTTKRRATKARSTKRSSKIKAMRRPGRPAKQSDAKVSELSQGIVSVLKATPEQSIGEIAEGLRSKSADLKRPIAELLNAGAIKKKGQRRGTRYSVA